MIYKNAEVFYKDRFSKQDIRVDQDGMICIEERVGQSIEEVVMDLEGLYLIPGIVDVHTHGCLGKDFSTATIEEIKEMEAYYLSKGVTSVVATIITSTAEQTEKAIRTISAYSQSVPKTIIKGFHLEGPFFGVAKKGAHDERYLRAIDEAWFELIDTLANGKVKIISIDPTLENAKAFIEKHHQNKVIAIGHTIANYEQGIMAVEAGAKQITHLFNAMNGLHHREPGLVGVMNDCDVKAELIVDGIHVHPCVVRMCFKLHPEKMLIISDSISAAGLKEGETCISGGFEVTIHNEQATLANGTIAGSTCIGIDSLKKIKSFGVSEKEIILSATTRPAKVIGEKCGRIEAGYVADMIVIDKNNEIRGVIWQGEWLDLK